ncbi:Dabb family protein [Dactylosporangium sp. NPDC000555]|uniref:Dabb family protein n=1 Tax=Dactylosporangium sp. NPDC000555 TaxID=3154260 RepID=UPI00332AB7E8
MFTHAVMLTAGPNSPVGVDEAADLLKSLESAVPSVRSLTVARNRVAGGPPAADILVIAEFDDEDAYRAYRAHEAQIAVHSRLSPHWAETRFVDFTVAVATRSPGTSKS